MGARLFTAYFMRHPQTTQNVGGENLDERTPLTERGWEQAEHIFEFIERERIQHVICSPADRTFGVLMEKRRSDIPVSVSPLFREWSRADKLREFQKEGVSKDDSRIKAIKLNRILNFGPDFNPLPGEEGWGDVLGIMNGGLKFVRDIALEHDPPLERLLVLTHRHRALMYKAFISAGMKAMDEPMLRILGTHPLLFPELFKLMDANYRFDNTDYLEFYYGQLYGKETSGWSIDIGKKIC